MCATITSRTAIARHPSSASRRAVVWNTLGILKVLARTSTIARRLPTSIQRIRSRPAPRLVQCKTSLERGSIPTQDEPEGERYGRAGDFSFARGQTKRRVWARFGSYLGRGCRAPIQTFRAVPVPRETAPSIRFTSASAERFPALRPAL